LPTQWIVRARRRVVGHGHVDTAIQAAVLSFQHISAVGIQSFIDEYDTHPCLLVRSGRVFETRARPWAPLRIATGSDGGTFGQAGLDVRGHIVRGRPAWHLLQIQRQIGGIRITSWDGGNVQRGTIARGRVVQVLAVHLLQRLLPRDTVSSGAILSLQRIQAVRILRARLPHTPLGEDALGILATDTGPATPCRIGTGRRRRSTGWDRCKRCAAIGDRTFRHAGSDAENEIGLSIGHNLLEKVGQVGSVGSTPSVRVGRLGGRDTEMRGAIVRAPKREVLRLECRVAILCFTGAVLVERGTIIQCRVRVIASKLSVCAWRVFGAGQGPFAPPDIFTRGRRRWCRRRWGITGTTLGIAGEAQIELEDAPPHGLNVAVVVGQVTGIGDTKGRGVQDPIGAFTQIRILIIEAVHRVLDVVLPETLAQHNAATFVVVIQLRAVVPWRCGEHGANALIDQRLRLQTFNTPGRPLTIVAGGGWCGDTALG